MCLSLGNDFIWFHAASSISVGSSDTSRRTWILQRAPILWETLQSSPRATEDPHRSTTLDHFSMDLIGFVWCWRALGRPPFGALRGTILGWSSTGISCAEPWGKLLCSTESCFRFPRFNLKLVKMDENGQFGRDLTTTSARVDSLVYSALCIWDVDPFFEFLCWMGL